MISKQSSAIQNKWAVDPRCVLLLHCDGANNGTTFVDHSPSHKTVTVNGDAKTVTAVKRLGNASAAFDGTGDYLTLATSTDFNLVRTFTISGWVYRVGTGTQVFYGSDDTSAAAGQWLCLWSAANQLTIQLRDTVTWTIVGGVIPVNTWTHIAIISDGTMVTAYVNGTYLGQNAITTDVTNANGIAIANRAGGTTLCLTGNIDELAIWNGVAIPISDLYPQRTPLYDYALSEPQGV